MQVGVFPHHFIVGLAVGDEFVIDLFGILIGHEAGDREGNDVSDLSFTDKSHAAAGLFQFLQSEEGILRVGIDDDQIVGVVGDG